MDELERRGQANGLQGLRRLGPEEIREYEPHTVGIAGLLVPETGIIDYKQVSQVYADIIRKEGGEIQTKAQVHGCRRYTDELVLETSRGAVHCRYLVNCGGLHADEVARICGVDPQLQIVPFRGEYYELVPERQFLVKNLIYPVPDPRFPFLGVHFTRMIHGGVEAGPNAVLAFKREGYRWEDFSPRDTLKMFSYPGFWKMAQKYWQTALGEVYRSLSQEAFVKALQKLVPELRMQDVHPAGRGFAPRRWRQMGRWWTTFGLSRPSAWCTCSMLHRREPRPRSASAKASLKWLPRVSPSRRLARALEPRERQYE